MIYLDNAATTPILPEVIEAINPYLTEQWYNPSSHYSPAESVMSAIENARTNISRLIECQPSEIYFTSGGSESDNWALKSVALKYGQTKKHIITTKIEHKAILNTCKFLEQLGYDITYLNVNYEGLIDLEELRNSIRPDTILISIMTANNEIGTIQPIYDIGQIAHAHNILFHTDAVQAFGHIPINVQRCHIDLLSASGHKLGAPKGVGILYVRHGIEMEPLIHGGSQENGLRASTYNTVGIIGMGKAAEIAMSNMYSNLKTKRDKLIDNLMNSISNIHINGSLRYRLSNNINICINKVGGDVLSTMLDMYGIYVSTGSACLSDSAEPSYVLKAIGLSDEEANSSIRVTLGYDVTDEQMDYFVEKLKDCVERIRTLGKE